jgi:hypothetical protein
MMELFKIVLTMTFHCYMAYAPPYPMHTPTKQHRRKTLSAHNARVA